MNKKTAGYILSASLLLSLGLHGWVLAAAIDNPNDPSLIDNSPPDVTPPANVTSFKAVSLDGQVALSWVNPTDADFVRTLVIRKSGSAPASRTDGTSVYEGVDVSFTDTKLTNGATYYYTAYSFDNVPNYASGVTVSATPTAGKTQANTPATPAVPAVPGVNGLPATPASPSGTTLQFGGNPSASAPYPTGSLVNDNGTIYLIVGLVKIPFTNYAAFRGLGYSLRNVQKGDLSGFSPSHTYTIQTSSAEHAWGSWLSVGRTIYYSTEQGLVPVSSWSVFVNNGGQTKFILKANRYDLAILKANPNLPVLTENDLRVIR